MNQTDTDNLDAIRGAFVTLKNAANSHRRNAAELRQQTAKKSAAIVSEQ